MRPPPRKLLLAFAPYVTADLTKAELEFFQFLFDAREDHLPGRDVGCLFVLLPERIKPARYLARHQFDLFNRRILVGRRPSSNEHIQVIGPSVF